MRTGALVSAAAHAALLALVLRGLPWLRPHPEDPVPAVEVSLVTAAELAAAEAAAVLPRGAVAPPAPEPEPPKPAPEPPRPDPRTSETATTGPDGIDVELFGEEISLAPAFDPQRPLGLPDTQLALATPDSTPEAAPTPANLAPAAAARPRPRPESPAPERGAAGSADRAAAAAPPGPSAADLRAGLAAAVHAALAEAQVYPRRARDRGVTGAAGLSLTITRDGRLLAARLAASSGSAALDAASLAAARNANYPAAPAALPGAHFTFTVRLVFTP
jgi:periplasmic protein TonB